MHTQKRGNDFIMSRAVGALSCDAPRASTFRGKPRAASILTNFCPKSHPLCATWKKAAWANQSSHPSRPDESRARRATFTRARDDIIDAAHFKVAWQNFKAPFLHPRSTQNRPLAQSVGSYKLKVFAGRKHLLSLVKNHKLWSFELFSGGDECSGRGCRCPCRPCRPPPLPERCTFTHTLGETNSSEVPTF